MTTVIDGTTGSSIAGNATVTGNLTVTGSITAASGTGNYALNVYVAPATWTKPTGLRAVKVTVVGGGGTGGNTSAPAPTSNSGYAGGGGGGGGAILYLDASAIPGPITVTAGPGTNSFGPLASATGGSNGVNGTQPSNDGAGGAGGTGTAPSPTPNGSITFTGVSGQPGNAVIRSVGGSSQLFYAQPLTGTGPNANGAANPFYGGGGSGSGIITGGQPGRTGGAGGPGVVIIEEFY
jgi:hypothetical protein